MIADELIRELQTFPPDWEIHIEVDGVERVAKSVDMESGGTGVWIMITDKVIERKKLR